MRVVVSLGGSVIVPKELDIKFLRKFSELIKRRKRDKFCIVCGGGHIARIFTKEFKKLGLSESEAHVLGIFATHLNASLIKFMLGEEATLYLGDPRKAKWKSRIIVSGGYLPGWNTDVCAAYSAKALKADLLVNISNVKGIYDKDPRKYKKAKLIKEMTWREFMEKFSDVKMRPGTNFIWHPLAALICSKSKTRVVFIGKNIKNFEKLLSSKKFVGTVIHP